MQAHIAMNVDTPLNQPTHTRTRTHSLFKGCTTICKCFVAVGLSVGDRTKYFEKYLRYVYHPEPSWSQMTYNPMKLTTQKIHIVLYWVGRFTLCLLPLTLANYVWKAVPNKYLQIMLVAGTWNNVGWNDIHDCGHMALHMTAITQRYIFFIVINISPLVLQKYHTYCTPVRHWLCLGLWCRDFSSWYMFHVKESLGHEQWWFSAASNQVAQLEICNIS
jgi:hypothetical protein